jgi:pilus assembly protein CpaB
MILLVGALVVAAVTAFMARSLVAGSSAPQANAQLIAPPPAAPTGPEVLVATKGLPVGTILDLTAFKFQPWPNQMVDGAYYIKKGDFDPKSLQGTVVRTAITAGQPLTQGALVKPGDRGFLAAALTPGMRAITIPINGGNGVAGFVFPGDHVDLVLSQKVAGGGDGPPLNVSETIVRNLRVLATDQRTTNDVDETGKPVVKTFAMVTVEVSPSLAEKISVARDVDGGNLSLVLRPLAENASQLDEAIASGSVTVPDGKDPKAEKAMIDRAESQPSSGKTSYATGADVSRFLRRSVPGKPGNVPNGAAVHIARGNSVTDVPVGIKVDPSTGGKVDPSAGGIN